VLVGDGRPTIRLGISSCLLGEMVRYDGGHKLDRYLRDVLGEFVEYVPVCPEAEVGLGTPREAMRLVGDPAAPRLVTVRTGIDHTDRMRTWARRRVGELARENLCGFVFKSRSPSSGMERVKVYSAKGMPRKVGVGLFARAFMERFPLLPVEEDGRLNDARIRENFIERIFTLARWKDLVDRRKTRGNLVRFHTRHKLLILAHSRKHHTRLGRLVARAKEVAPSELYREYVRILMEGMKLHATVKKHVDVMQHCMGYFKKVLTSDEKRELLDHLDAFRAGYLPLIVPVTLINHYVRKYDEPYLKEQVYLNPHPVELKLRNHA
jgi:uncharacterized protein YbgA (DUF1722 family)/uncharacterized protein YbbK (DUF523 family)